MSFQKINRFLREIWFKRKWTRKNKSLFLWELFCFFLTRKTVKKKAGWKHQPRLLIPPKLTLSKYYCYYCVQNTCCLPNKKAFPTSFFSFRIYIYNYNISFQSMILFTNVSILSTFFWTNSSDLDPSYCSIWTRVTVVSGIKQNNSDPVPTYSGLYVANQLKGTKANLKSS